MFLLSVYSSFCVFQLLSKPVKTYVFFFQDVEANPDKDDSRSLNIVIQQPFSRRSKSGFNPLPIMSAKFVFDDYIRCMSARQRLQKRRDALKHRKMSTMATLLELPSLAAPPAHFYSLTSCDSPSFVWSPSSRGYSSPRQSNSSPNTPAGMITLTPVSSAQKSKLLSPKHEEILQKQLKGDVVDSGGERKTLSTVKSTPSFSLNTPLKRDISVKREAEALASLLKDTPSGLYEVSGYDSGRERSGTTEIGEEICEDSITLSESSSSFVLLNASASVERHSELKQRAIKKQTQHKKGKTNPISVQDIKKPSRMLKLPSAELIDKSSFKKCQSAPASPSGRRHQKEVCETSYRLSKSLPAIAIQSVDENKDRRQRAQRARAKAKSVKTKKLRR